MCGCSQDDVDVRGRWKLASRQQDTYVSTTIPYIGGKVASALCHLVGLIAYVVKQESGVTDNWICTHVMLRTAEKYPKQK